MPSDLAPAPPIHPVLASPASSQSLATKDADIELDAVPTLLNDKEMTEKDFEAIKDSAARLDIENARAILEEALQKSERSGALA